MLVRIVYYIMFLIIIDIKISYFNKLLKKYIPILSKLIIFFFISRLEEGVKLRFSTHVIGQYKIIAQAIILFDS